MTFHAKTHLDAAGVALAAKRGERTSHDLSGTPKQFYDNLTESELEEMAYRAAPGDGHSPRA
ncbi:DUF3008 family protein [Celeribacter sp.]|uniref:DUF3008 family protein n=1 Tax=Celeribacter sp. TaxID=1890673 RepID=UPI003A9367E6